MLATTLDYNSAIRYQSKNLERGKKRFENYISVTAKGEAKAYPAVDAIKLIKDLNGIFTSQFLSAKGALADLQENIVKVKGTDLSVSITAVENLLRINISFLTEIEDILKNCKKEQHSLLLISQSVVSETIETIYAIIRILKKVNLKSPIETSELAKDLSRVSVNSLQKVLYGRD